MRPRRIDRWIRVVSGAKRLGGTSGRPLAMAQGDEVSLKEWSQGVTMGLSLLHGGYTRPEYDLIIRNGTIVDGTGSPR
jgi:hypothetical protein